jgi:hypothetical protein
MVPLLAEIVGPLTRIKEKQRFSSYSCTHRDHPRKVQYGC